MDVNTTLKNLNYGNNYDTSITEKANQTNNQTDNTEVSSAENKDTQQDNTKDNSNKLNGQKDLDKTMDKLNKLLEKDQTHAEYSFYKELNRTVIRIVDDKTKKTVMEFPSEKLLDAISSLLENAGIIDKKA